MVKPIMNYEILIEILELYYLLAVYFLLNPFKPGPKVTTKTWGEGLRTTLYISIKERR